MATLLRRSVGGTLALMLRPSLAPPPPFLRFLSTVEVESTCCGGADGGGGGVPVEVEELLAKLRDQLQQKGRFHSTLALAENLILSHKGVFPSPSHLFRALVSGCPDARPLPDFAATIIVSAYASLNFTNEALDFVSYVEGERPDLFPFLPSCNLLHEALVFRKRYSDVLSLFCKLVVSPVRPDTFSYNKAIQSVVKSGDPNRAMEFFHLMESKDHLKPDAFTFNCLISCLYKQQRISDAEKMYEEMMRRGIAPTLIAYNTVIDGHSKTENLDAAFAVRDQMQASSLKPNLITYNTLLSGLCRACRMDDAKNLLDEMRVAAGMASTALKLLGRRLSFCSFCRCGDRCAAAPTANPSFPFRSNICFPPPSFRFGFSSSSSPTSSELLHDSSISEEPPTDAADVFRRWGLTDAEAASALVRCPILCRMNLSSLDDKIKLLGGLGLIGSDLVKVVVSCPRFVTRLLGAEVQSCLGFLRTLFASDADLTRAIVRKPSLLSYDVERTFRPCIRLYESVGVDALGVGQLILCRPMIITNSSLDDEKLELLRRIPIRREVAMYKYVVGVLATSNLEALQTKIANLERFGISSDEVMKLFARSPYLLTLSMEKVQRNMTYLMGTIKIPSDAIIRYPLLVLCNLDTMLKPRHMLGVKLEEMGLQGGMKAKDLNWLIRALRMKEEQFLEEFVRSQPENFSWKLMEYYSGCKGLRKLAESSRTSRKKTSHC